MSTLLVASAGGHIAQLHALHRRLIGDEEPVWVTFKTPQTQSLLEGEVVEWLDYIPPRGWAQIARSTPAVRSILKRHSPAGVYSTGSGIALAVMPLARVHGVPCTYVESAARSGGPSVTGKILQRVPGVECRTQYKSWADEKWVYRGSIFDDYVLGDAEAVDVKTVTVTMGTIRPFGFERLLDRLLQIVPPDVRVFCQVGETRVGPRRLPPNFEVVESVPARELAARAAASDAIVAHAGVGSSLLALNSGHRPVLVIRRAAHEEHIDDHQEQIASELAARHLAVQAEADQLSWADILRAASRRVGTEAQA